MACLALNLDLAAAAAATASNAVVEDPAATTSAIYQIWSEWNLAYATSIGTSVSYNVTTAGDCWQVWNQPYTTGAASVTWGTWGTWNAQWVPTTYANVEVRVPTDEELAAAIARGNETKRVRDLAEATARALLIDNLDADQRKQFEAAQTFEVLSRDGKRIYQVRYGKAGNVFLMKNGKPVSKFCIHPTDSRIPTEDVMLVQKLMIEGAEEEFLRIANRSAA